MEYEKKLIEEYLSNTPKVKKEKQKPNIFNGLITIYMKDETQKVL